MNEHPEMNPPSNFEAGARTCSLLSVVVPCFNEEEVLPETHRRLIEVLETLPAHAFELIYVDDGSRDATLDILRGLQGADARVRVVSLSRNFGQHIASTAGLQSAAGQSAVVIDADFQNPPETISEMLDCWGQGADIIYGQRILRIGAPAFERGMSGLFFRIFNRISGVHIPRDSTEFRLMDRAVVDAVSAMPERDRFPRGIVAWIGFLPVPVHFNQAPRAAGETKWTLGKKLHFAMDGFLSFSLVPLRLATWLGLLSTGLALAGIMYVLVLRLLTNTWISGWVSLFIAVLFLGGVQLVLLGVLGEYVGRIHGEAKRRPLYFVKERLGFTSISR